MLNSFQSRSKFGKTLKHSPKADQGDINILSQQPTDKTNSYDLALTKNKDMFVGYIISDLLADEVKHHEMLSRLEHVKGKVYPYGTAKEERIGASK